MLEILFTLVSMYLVFGVATYLYIVVKNFEMTEVWDFKVGEVYIGISPYPRWLLWWLRKLMVTFKWS